MVLLCRFREADRGLECVAAGVALPQMAHAQVIDQFRPFWQEQAVATLRALKLRAWSRRYCGGAGVKFHWGILRFFYSGCPRPVLSLVFIMTIWTRGVKQQS